MERTLHDFNKVIKHIIVMVINCNTTLRGEDYSNLHPSPKMIFKEGCKFLHWKIKISSQELQCYSEWYHYTVIQIIHSKCDTWTYSVMKLKTPFQLWSIWDQIFQNFYDFQRNQLETNKSGTDRLSKTSPSLSSQLTTQSLANIGSQLKTKTRAEIMYILYWFIHKQ